jgi:hypothetical protein
VVGEEPCGRGLADLLRGPARDPVEQRDDEPDQHEHPEHAGDGAGHPVDPGDAALGAHRPQPVADHQTQGLAEQGEAEEQAERGQQHPRRVAAAQAFDDEREHAHAHEEPDRHADPGDHTRDEPQAEAPHRRDDGEDEHRQVEQAHGSAEPAEGGITPAVWQAHQSPSRRACVRNPVWATMR